ncbi:MAG: glycosyltransferase [Siphonobacter sp.]
MKILNLCGYSWEIGGPAKVIYDNTTAQLNLGAEVTIVTPLSEGERLYTIPQGARVITCKRHWLARFIPEFSPELFTYYRKHAHEYDIVHIHGAFHFAGWVPFMIRSKAKKVFTVHGTLDGWALQKSAWKKNIISFLFQRKMIERCDLIHVLNPEEKDDVTRYLAHQHPNIVVINNGIQLSQYETLPARGLFRAKYNLDTNTPIILFLSRINVKKGLDLLLPAFLEVLNKFPSTHLFIAGPDDGFLDYVISFIKDHNLSKQVTLTGMLTGTDKLEAIVDADIFALPTYSEGFSMAAIEAMACGTALLTTNRVGFGHLLKNTNTAELVTLEISDVTRGINQLLENPENRHLIAANGKKLAWSIADINVVATKLYRAFESLLAR